ncbi:uncharacterized protein LOC142234564 isoform X1 [Haematobia irritans]|uniref:uncharacterized protein LOC142234564 isoform X1 n=1 Tax=Haematobia irritans TaxID=7368 RepID=UPI003F500162
MEQGATVNKLLPNMDLSNLDNLSSKDIYSVLKNMEEKLEQNALPESERKKEIMNLLHDFNDIKDATQIVIGALANINCMTIKELHLKYNLPLNE